MKEKAKKVYDAILDIALVIVFILSMIHLFKLETPLYLIVSIYGLIVVVYCKGRVHGFNRGASYRKKNIRDHLDKNR